VGGLLDRVHRPELNSWDHLHQVALGFQEHFWAARVIEWLPLAGCVALLIRSRRGFLVAGMWFVAYLLVKGTYLLASLDDATFFRLLMPAFPAYVILAASVLLLVPGFRARATVAPPVLPRKRLTLSIAVAAVAFAAVPLAVIAATPPLHDGGEKALQLGISLIPVSTSIDVHAVRVGDGVRISWRPQRTHGGSLFYRIFRGHEPDVACGGRLNDAADDCRMYADDVGATRSSTFVDHPPPGAWTYRVGVAANWLNDPKLGDVYVISPPVLPRS
jgi:hypothetical protein